MKRIVHILLAAAVSSVSTMAQTNSSALLPREEDGARVTSLLAGQEGDLRSSIAPLPSDSLHLPLLDWRGQMLPAMLPFRGWSSGIGSWSLHEGLNMNLGTSVFGSWGGSKYLGTGFTQDVSMMYAMPLTGKLSVAVGGYFSNMFFARESYRSAGLSGVLSYRFNDHWEAYVYGQKSLVETNRKMPLWGMGNFGDRIGAGVIYHVDPTLSFEVNVEYMNLPGRSRFQHPDHRSPLTPTDHGAPPPPR